VGELRSEDEAVGKLSVKAREVGRMNVVVLKWV